MYWTDILIAIVAAYGAIISTYTLITQLKKHKYKIKVKVSMGFFPNHNAQLSETMVFLSASNPGQKAVTLSSQGFSTPSKMTLFCPIPLTNVKFPYELLPGKNCQIWVEAKELSRVLREQGYSGTVKLIGFYSDQLDKTYKSNPFKFNVEEWSKET